MNRFRVGIAAALLAALSIALASAQTKPAEPARSRAATAAVEMTIDSIMRGPDLVGYPPTGLRWSGDSAEAVLRLAQAGRRGIVHVCRRPGRR